MVLVQQREQCVKADVGWVLPVAHASGGRMGHHNVHPACLPKGIAQLPDAPAHLCVGVLVSPRMILAAASKPQNPDPVDHHQGIVNAVAALRGPGGITVVVIAVDVKHRTPGHGYEKGQIIRPQVPAGQNEVIILQLSGPIIIPEALVFLVGNCQNSHSPSSFSSGTCSRWTPSSRTRGWAMGAMCA